MNMYRGDFLTQQIIKYSITKDKLSHKMVEIA